MIRFFQILLLLLLCNTFVYSQKINKLNKHGQRTGKWVVYLDSAKTKKSTEGRYRKGNPRGKFYYYTMDGLLERREITRFNRLKTTLYYPNKTIRFKGKARIDNEIDRIHYYFFGKWRYYDEQGKLLKYCYYKKGILQKTVYVDKNNKTNDSLTNALNAMDERFNSINSNLLDSIRMSMFNIPKKERLELELFMTDTLTFHDLEVIFKNYGYPPKNKVHDSGVIPFYILSYAPTGIKEKYLPLLTSAAGNGDLEWKSLAFFIDKIKVAKAEKQIYGTQYYYSQGKQIPYPIEDPEHLEERRKKVGLK